jgi:hypothetical protein
LESNIVYAAQGWGQLLTTEIDLDGDEQVVDMLTDRLVEALHRHRHVYFFECLGSYSNDAGITILRDTFNVNVHERWHEFVGRHGLDVSTVEGMPIEEPAALLVEQFAAGNTGQADRHKAASRAFISLYRQVMAEPCSDLVRQRIMDVAKVHAYSEHYRQYQDPRLSPWAFLADDLKYMLYYLLCYDVAMKGIEFAKKVFIEALRKVKEHGSLQAGIDLLKAHARPEIAALYDFPAMHFDADVPLAFPTMDGEDIFLDGRLKIRVYSSDDEATDVALRTVAEFIESYHKP